MDSEKKYIEPPKFDLRIFDSVLSTLKKPPMGTPRIIEGNNGTIDETSFFKETLALNTLQHSFLWLVQQNLPDLTVKARNENPLPKLLNEFSLIQRFSNNATIHSKRYPRTLPLTETEYSQAHQFIKKNPKLYDSFAFFHYGLKVYFTKLEESVRKSNFSTEKKTAAAALLKHLTESGIKSLAITQELLPIIAYKESQRQDDNLDISKATQRGLAFAFQRHAFDAKISHHPQTMTCPMKAVIGQLINTGFERDDDGKLHISKDPVPGGLIAQIYDALEQPQEALYQPATTTTEASLHQK